MLGAKEQTLLKDAKKWRNEVNKIIYRLNKALKPGNAELLEKGKTLQDCLKRARELKHKIDDGLDKYTDGIWPLRF